jgi:hypothetical protein
LEYALIMNSLFPVGVDRGWKPLPHPCQAIVGAASSRDFNQLNEWISSITLSSRPASEKPHRNQPVNSIN